MPVTRAVISLGAAALVAIAALVAFALPARADESVSIAGMAFGPANVTVNVGETVTWTNNDGAMPHTVTSTDGGPLDSGTLNDGDTYSFTFTEAGSFQYQCAIHPTMTGTVTVQAAAEEDDTGNGAANGDDDATDAAPPATGTGTGTGDGSGSAAMWLIIVALAVVLIGGGLIGFRTVRNR